MVAGFIVAADLLPFPDFRDGAWTCRLVEFRARRAFISPYLADHGFHDLVVLPGAFYIELARRIHRELFERDAASLRDIEFEHPVILTSDEDVSITVRVEPSEDGSAAYESFDATGDVVRNSAASRPCARLTKWNANLAVPSAGIGLIPVRRQSSNAPALSDLRMNFTEALRRNGNEYGPSFQVLAGISRSGPLAGGDGSRMRPWP